MTRISQRSPVLSTLAVGCLGLALCSTAATAASVAKGGKVDFNRDIRPILSEHCYTCHGPDAGKLKARLRFDLKESALGKAKSGKLAVLPGAPGQSEMIRRITSLDPDEVMPPPKEGKPLQPRQVELLTRWVQEGAVWAGHWAFEPISRPAVPEVRRPAGPIHNAIDSFVQVRLRAEKLDPAPEEERARLIRRVSLDLTGLPPTIQEVEEFMKDSSPKAFAKVVDRLLVSPHFGERLALPWLDLARYGDTSGYHNDSLRDMWLWREWVINSFNANKPFDAFTVEQLAGDLLPHATVQQQVASGFHRNHMTSDEGGLIDAEYRNLYVVDRVSTTGVTWLGLTVGCAQCHDHKYDPVTQRDFYRVYAFFNNVPENGKDGVRDRNPKPFLRVTSSGQDGELKRRDEEAAAAEKHLAEFTKTLAARQAAWETQAVASGISPEPSGPVVIFPLDGNGDGVSASGRKIEGRQNGTATFVDGSVGKSYRIEAKGWIDCGEQFGFETNQAFTAGAWLRLKPEGGSPFGKMEGAPGFRGWDVEFHGLRPSVHLSHKWPDEVLHVQAEADLPPNVFLHLAFSYDGSGKAAGLKLYVNGVAVKTAVKADKLTGTMRTAAPFSIGRRGSLTAPFTGRVDDLRLYERLLNGPEIASLSGGARLALVAIPADKRTAPQKEQLEKYFRETHVPELAGMQKNAADLRAAKDTFERDLPNTMVMSEMAKPRDTFIKVRGNYDKDGEKVLPAVPAFLPQVAARADDQPLNRLDFARWLVSPEHPLTARVAVNRWWALLFGTGLVRTLNDFGAQGERPSHPELLDWLAADFMRDWDTKRAIRQMVLSATYRQSARASQELLSRDGANRLLARGPRQRLDAELIRDNALAIGGILNPALGGRSIKPSQPEGTWEINEMSGYKYEKSKGDSLYRRGLYVYWRRSTVYPSFVTLDAPTREFCVAQRAKTSTPLQSLVLMNDPVFVEAARAFAQRVLKEGGQANAARIDFAWRLALARPPSRKEQAILDRTLQENLTTYRNDPEAARKLVSVGDLPRPAELNESELAAWTAVGNMLLNLNETISN